MPKSDDDKPPLPSIREALSEWLGVRLPGLPPMPQTLKNLDKAVSAVVLSVGQNLTARVDANTGKVTAVAEVSQRAITQNTEDSRKVENRTEIGRLALEEIATNPGPSDALSEIEDDWLNTFSRSAEDKTSDDLRRLYSRILAGEIRQPGSFSLRTLQFISAISRKEADSISKYFSFAFSGEVVPNYEESQTPEFEHRMFMEELGLASSPSSAGGLYWNVELEPNSYIVFDGREFGVRVVNNGEAKLTFDFPCQALSQIAKELLLIANPPPIGPSFAEEFALNLIKHFESEPPKVFKEGKILIQLVEIIPGSDEVKRVKDLYPPKKRK